MDDLGACELRTRMPTKPTELEQMRFEYAWNWFNFHAEQRTKMFNFMLIGMGIFATAFVTAIDKKLLLESAVVSTAAAVVGVVFFLIDRRNRQLYTAAMDVLEDAEKTVVFGDIKFMDHRDEQKTFGISRRINIDDGPRVPELDYVMRGLVNGKHRYWMPTVGLAFVMLFSAAAVRAWCIYFDASLRVPVTVVGALLFLLGLISLKGSKLPGLKPLPRHSAWLFLPAGMAALLLAWQVPLLSQPLKSSSDVDVVVGGDLNGLLDLRFKQPLGSARGTELGLLASARFGPFASGDDALDCSSAGHMQGVEDIRTALEDARRRQQRVLLLLVGMADRTPLSQPLRQRYGSNAGLARARVSAAERCLLAPGATPLPSDVLRVIGGPAYTPASAEPSDAARQGMEADREVRAVVVGLQAAR